MQTTRQTFCLIAACCAAASAWAQEYRALPDPWTEQMLNMQKNHFELDSVNRSGNVCKLNGHFQGQGRQHVYEDGRGCRVVFAFHAQGVAVSIPEGSRPACRAYCGHNVRMEGNYQRLPSACRHSAEQQTAQRFQVAYLAGRFDEAIRLRNAWLQQCGRLVHALTQMRALNDLAAAYQKTGNQAACRRVLQPWQAEIEDVKDANRPGSVFREEYARELQTARRHWQSCTPR
ncbi:MAG: hypothetical protein Q4A62_03310 [Eikenella sp.]|nr:hypothetical protein [Eikenella sp.]